MTYMITCEKAPKGQSILKTGETIQQSIVETMNDALQLKRRWHAEAHEAKIGIWVTIDKLA